MSTICATHTQTQCYEDKRKAQHGNKWVQSRGIQIGVRQRSAGGITLVGKQREPHHLIASSIFWMLAKTFLFCLWDLTFWIRGDRTNYAWLSPPRHLNDCDIMNTQTDGEVKPTGKVYCLIIILLQSFNNTPPVSFWLSLLAVTWLCKN